MKSIHIKTRDLKTYEFIVVTKRFKTLKPFIYRDINVWRFLFLFKIYLQHVKKFEKVIDISSVTYGLNRMSI